MVVKKLPSINVKTLWLNKPVKDTDLDGFAVLIHFFSLSCGLCHRMLPMIINWDNIYSTKGLKCIGVHQIKSLADENIKEVKKFIRKNQIPYPVAFDEGGKLSKNFNNTLSPSFYFFDKSGKLRHFLAGEKGVDFLIIAVEKYFSKIKEITFKPNS